MKEIITSIIQAEDFAEQIVTDAHNKAKAFTEKNEEQLVAEKKKTVALMGLERKTAVKEAEAQAEERYREVIEQAEAQAKEIKERAKEKIDAISNIIVDGIVK